jgi:hypothetical protein
VRQLQEGHPPPFEDALGLALGPDDLGQDVLVPPVLSLLPEDMLGVVIVQKLAGADRPRLPDGGSVVKLNRAGVAPGQAAAEAVPVAARRQVFSQVPGDIDRQPTADAGHAAGKPAERPELHAALAALDPHSQQFPPGLQTDEDVPGFVDSDFTGHLPPPGVSISFAPEGAGRSAFVDLGAYNGCGSFFIKTGRGVASSYNPDQPAPRHGGKEAAAKAVTMEAVGAASSSLVLNRTAGRSCPPIFPATSRSSVLKRA